MSGFGDLKNRKFLKLLSKLARTKGVIITRGGRHNTKVTVVHTGETYPIPTSHRVVNKHIAKDFMEWLVRQEVCSEEEFRNLL